MPPFILISFLHPFSIDHNMLILRHKDFQLGSYFQVKVYRPFVVVELPFKPILTLSFFSWPSRCDIGLKVLPFSFVPLKNTAQAISYLVAFKKQEDHISTQVMPRQDVEQDPWMLAFNHIDCVTYYLRAGPFIQPELVYHQILHTCLTEAYLMHRQYSREHQIGAYLAEFLPLEGSLYLVCRYFQNFN